jgi:hypothetical protein
MKPTRKVFPHACTLHFECNDPVSSGNAISVFSGLHHSISGRNELEMNDRIKWLRQRGARYKLLFVAFDLFTIQPNGCVAYIDPSILKVCGVYVGI